MTLEAKNLPAWIGAAIVVGGVVLAVGESRWATAQNTDALKKYEAKQETARAERRAAREAQIRYELNQKAIEGALGRQQKAVDALIKKIEEGRRPK